MKNHLTKEDTELLEKESSPRELLLKYSDEIDTISKYDKDTTLVFGFYNAWWVFGEVARDLDYDIFMAEAENVGYKRSKRGENPMPNDLYDLEYAPMTLDTQEIIADYTIEIQRLSDLKIENEAELKALEMKFAEKESDTLKKKIEKLEVYLDVLNQKITTQMAEKELVIQVFETYYPENNLKANYTERTDTVLINHFKNGVLSRYKSKDIVLRNTETLTILDSIRKEVVWE